MNILHSLVVALTVVAAAAMVAVPLSACAKADAEAAAKADGAPAFQIGTIDPARRTRSSRPR